MSVRSDPLAEIRRLGRPGDLGWVVLAHGEQYATEFGWDTECEALVTRIVADYADSPEPDAEAAWIAEHDGARVGCVFCVRDAEPGVARLRLLLVTDEGRGHRLGSRLLDASLAFARDAGYARVRLWTNDPLVAARRLYLDRGFVLTDEAPHRSFGRELVGQTYERALTRSSGRAG